MILTTKLMVRWHRKTIEHYNIIFDDKGKQKYNFTGYGKSFFVDFPDVHPNCTIKINIKCDYCSKEHTKIYRNWKIHFDNSPLKKDACSKCRGKKTKESNLKRYGVANVMHLNEIKERLMQTNIKRYGVTNAALTKEVKDKMERSVFEKYGTKHYFKTNDFKEKYKKKCKKNMVLIIHFKQKKLKKNQGNQCLRTMGSNTTCKMLKYAKRQ